MKMAEQAIQPILDVGNDLFKAIGKHKFDKVKDLIETMDSLLAEASKLVGAYQPGHIFKGYPFKRKSDYLKSTIPEEALQNIIAVVATYKCSCLPAKCKCSCSEESTVSANGFSCWFCKESILRDTPAYWLTEKGDVKGTTICKRCNNFLFDKVYSTRGLEIDLINLVEDAFDETRFFQFHTARKLLQQAREMLAKVPEG